MLAGLVAGVLSLISFLFFLLLQHPDSNLHSQRLTIFHFVLVDGSESESFSKDSKALQVAGGAVLV